jgi:hypothetical protein
MNGHNRDNKYGERSSPLPRVAPWSGTGGTLAPRAATPSNAGSHLAAAGAAAGGPRVREEGSGGAPRPLSSSLLLPLVLSLEVAMAVASVAPAADSLVPSPDPLMP